MYHVHFDGKNHGPYLLDQIKSMWASGIVTADAMYWTEGETEWKPITYLVAPNISTQPVPQPETKAENISPPIPPTPSVHIGNSVLPVGFRDPSALANWLTGFLVVSLLFGLAAIWSGSLQLDLLNRIANGAQISSSVANDNDTRQRILGFIQTGIFIVTSIIFGRWIFVVASNVRQFGAQNLQFTPRWAVGYYFVPVVCLWKPYQAMKEIWKASHAPVDWQNQKGSFILGLCWTFWVISCLAGQMYLRAFFGAKTVTGYIELATCSMFIDIIDIPLCLFAILLVRRLSATQTQTAKGQFMASRQTPALPQNAPFESGSTSVTQQDSNPERFDIFVKQLNAFAMIAFLTLIVLAVIVAIIFWTSRSLDFNN